MKNGSECSICDRKFKSQTGLYLHLSRAHFQESGKNENQGIIMKSKQTADFKIVEARGFQEEGFDPRIVNKLYTCPVCQARASCFAYPNCKQTAVIFHKT